MLNYQRVNDDELYSIMQKFNQIHYHWQRYTDLTEKSWDSKNHTTISPLWKVGKNGDWGPKHDSSG
jgi:hypothetical protein